MAIRLTTLGIAVATVLAAPLASASVPPLVDNEWLGDRLQDDSVAIIDVRSPIDNGDEIAFSDGHIPGAADGGYADTAWRAERDGVIGQLPPIESLEDLIGALGVDNADTVVVVPAGTGPTDFGSAARVYWTFKALGHDAVTILNGGYRGWVAADQPIATGQPRVEPASFEADLQSRMLVSTSDVENAEARGLQLVDARPSAFFEGERKHPAARVAGTLATAINLPHSAFGADGDVWRFDSSRVQTAIDGVSLGSNRRPVSFCNTGHWATTTWFALSEVRGIDNVGLYDGSMVAWTADESRPVEVAKRGLARILEFFGG